MRLRSLGTKRSNTRRPQRNTIRIRSLSSFTCSPFSAFPLFDFCSCARFIRLNRYIGCIMEFMSVLLFGYTIFLLIFCCQSYASCMHSACIKIGLYGTYTEEMWPQPSNRIFSNVGGQLAYSWTKCKYQYLIVGILQPRWYAITANGYFRFGRNLIYFGLDHLGGEDLKWKENWWIRNLRLFFVLGSNALATNPSLGTHNTISAINLNICHWAIYGTWQHG